MKRFYILVVVLIMLALVFVVLLSLSGTQQTAYAFTAENVKTIKATPGDTISFTGSGAPDANVNIRVSTMTSVGVSDNMYGISLHDVDIPGSSNGFSVTAYPVRSMTVAGNSLSARNVAAVKGIKVSDGRGSFSISNVPADRYDLMVYGEADGPAVNVEASASCVLPTDNSGAYTGSVSTSGMPAGTYNVWQDGALVATVYLGVPVPG